MNAIFAFSSRHMHIGNHRDVSALQYGNLCSQKLRPMLQYDETMSDENMFAAAIILRVWEEMEGRSTLSFDVVPTNRSSREHEKRL